MSQNLHSQLDREMRLSADRENLFRQEKARKLRRAAELVIEAAELLRKAATILQYEDGFVPTDEAPFLNRKHDELVEQARKYKHRADMQDQHNVRVKADVITNLGLMPGGIRTSETGRNVVAGPLSPRSSSPPRQLSPRSSSPTSRFENVTQHFGLMPGPGIRTSETGRNVVAGPITPRSSSPRRSPSPPRSSSTKLSSGSSSLTSSLNSSSPSPSSRSSSPRSPSPSGSPLRLVSSTRSSSRSPSRSPSPSRSSLSGQNIVFRGFRSTGLENAIKMQGGKVTNSINGNTTLLVVANVSDSDEPHSYMLGEQRRASKLGVPVMDRDKFLLRYNLFL